MIAKGLDFPRVTLVGVVDADLPLRMEDFRASGVLFRSWCKLRGGQGVETGQGKFMFKPMLLMKAVFNLQEERSWTPFWKRSWRSVRIEISPLSSFNTACVSGEGRGKNPFLCGAMEKTLGRLKPKDIDIKGPAATPLAKIKGYYRYHLFYLTSSVNHCLSQIQKLRQDFPIDKEIFDILDVDAHQVS